MTTDATVQRGPCVVCGSPELLRGDGGVRTHRTWRRRRAGTFRDSEHCPGSGQWPGEPVPDPVAA